jgi:iron complex outermembrane recepter protein
VQPIVTSITLTGIPTPRIGSRGTRAVWIPVFVVGVALLLTSPADAQRAKDNAVTAASDAFGTVVGNQTVGLYTPTNARGFSPTQAENVRIEGLYFDQRTSSSDPYLFTGTDMRVGIAAQSYAFPSPSGIADLKVRTPGNTAGASIVLNRGPLEQYSAEVDTQYPLTEDSLSVGINVAAAQNFDYDFALKSARRAISLVLRFQPNPGTEIIPFFGYVHNFEHAETPFVYSDRVHPLPLFDAQRLPTQSWTTWGWNQSTAGLIAKVAITGPWSLRAGLFRSAQEEAQNYNDLFLGVVSDGLADHVMDVSPAHTSSSYSGDLRVTRSVSDDTHRRELTFAVRGRHVNRHYGGDSITDLGPMSIYENVSVPQPAMVFSEQNRDEVRQTGVGINYSELWKDRASLGLGMLVTDYSRTIRAANLPATAQHTTELLPTVSFTANAFRTVTVYGSYTRGLEDSMTAPTEAVNRGEPPPATPTWQIDGGARVILRPYLQLLIGAFKIHKIYFGLDTANRYGQVGEISARGVESSATLTGPDGLTVVAGGVWLRPEVKRQIPERGGSGNVPVGPVPRTININVDYAPGNWRGWGTTMQWTALSSRVETGDNFYRLPPLATLKVGLRYVFKLFDRPFSARLDVGNITNATGLTISSAYVATPQLRRNYTFTFAADL